MNDCKRCGRKIIAIHDINIHSLSFGVCTNCLLDFEDWWFKKERERNGITKP